MFFHVQLFCILKRNHDRRHLNTKCHTNSENDCEPYNKQFIDLACSVFLARKTSVRYFTVQTSRSVNKPLISAIPITCVGDVQIKRVKETKALVNLCL